MQAFFRFQHLKGQRARIVAIDHTSVIQQLHICCLSLDKFLLEHSETISESLQAEERILNLPLMFCTYKKSRRVQGNITPGENVEKGSLTFSAEAVLRLCELSSLILDSAAVSCSLAKAPSGDE